MNTVNIKNFPPLSFAASEAMNTLCTNLSFEGTDIKRIMLTSCHPSEGKSFISMNIMRAMAKLRKSVVLIDADLRRSMISTKYALQFEQDKPVGLAHYLAGMASESDIIYSTNIPGAYMIPVGREVANSLPMLVSPRFVELMNNLVKKVDYVIVDAPPLGAVVDALEIAKSCDGALIVVEYDSVRKQELIRVKEELEQTDCRILGTVLNRVEMGNYLSKKYYYKNYYSNGYDSYYSYYNPENDKKPENDKRTRKSQKK